jgi:hypothetical protein
VMVWWGVSYEGVTEPYFCEKGIKTSAQVYQDTRYKIELTYCKSNKCSMQLKKYIFL